MYMQKQLELKLNTSHKHARIKISLFTYSILELCSYKIYQYAGVQLQYSERLACTYIVIS